MSEILLVALASASIVSTPLFLVLPRLRLGPRAHVVSLRLAIVISVLAALPISLFDRIELPPGIRGTSASLWEGFSNYLAILWLLGFVLAIGRASVGHLKWLEVLGPVVPAPARVAEKVRTIAQKMGGPVPDVKISRSIRLPVVPLGRAPVMILGREVVDDDVLRHELAHVRGRDPSWFLAMRVLAAALWFHPLVWKFERAFHLAHEVRADAVAAPEDGVAYARRLLSSDAFFAGNLDAAFGSSISDLEIRIAAIRKPPKNKLGSVALGLVLLAAALRLGVQLPERVMPSSEFRRNEMAVPVYSLRANLWVSSRTLTIR